MQTVKTFNQATGSLESRVLPTARKFESLGIEAHQKELSELEPIAETARVLSAPEVLSEDEEFVE
jgi:DNA recombination protein RmuC